MTKEQIDQALTDALEKTSEKWPDGCKVKRVPPDDSGASPGKASTMYPCQAQILAGSEDAVIRAWASSQAPQVRAVERMAVDSFVGQLRAAAQIAQAETELKYKRGEITEGQMREDVELRKKHLREQLKRIELVVRPRVEVVFYTDERGVAYWRIWGRIGARVAE